VKMLDKAYDFVRSVAENDGIILFVGTKKQAQDAIETEAKRCGMYYVNNRWLGGMLTNYRTIRTRINRMKQLFDMEEKGDMELLPKKEVVQLLGEREKLMKNLAGIADMPRIPDAIFVVDPHKEHLAVTEARKLGIPVVGIVDTNCDPDEIDYVIPANDDAIRAVKLISACMANAVIEGHQGEQLDNAEAEEAVEAEAAEEAVEA